MQKNIHQWLSFAALKRYVSFFFHLSAKMPMNKHCYFYFCLIKTTKFVESGQWQGDKFTRITTQEEVSGRNSKHLRVSACIQIFLQQSCLFGDI